MASTQSSNHLTSRLAARTYVHDPADATVATKIAWVDMSTFSHFLALLTLISGTGVLTFKLFASAASDGSNPVEVKAHADPTVADAAGDQVVLELSAEELKGLGATLRYVSAEVDMDGATDAAAVTYIRSAGRFAYDGLTADVIA